MAKGCFSERGLLRTLDVRFDVLGLLEEVEHVLLSQHLRAAALPNQYLSTSGDFGGTGLEHQVGERARRTGNHRSSVP